MIPTAEQIIQYLKQTKTKDGELYGTKIIEAVMDSPIGKEYMFTVCNSPREAAQHWAGFATALDCVHSLEEAAKLETEVVQ